MSLHRKIASSITIFSVLLLFCLSTPSYAQFPLNPILLEDGTIVEGAGRRLDIRNDIEVTWDGLTESYKIDASVGTFGENSATGNSTEVQFNDGGTDLGADADFTWNKTTNTLTLGGDDERWTFTTNGEYIDGNDAGDGKLTIGGTDGNDVGWVFDGDTGTDGTIIWDVTNDEFDAMTLNSLKVMTPNLYDVSYFVEGYGAVCDGSTDDATAIQDAIDVAKDAGGGIVYLPAKKCKIASSVQLYDGVRFIGAGDSYNATGGNGVGTVLYMTGDAPAIVVDGDTGYGFEIAHMQILGDITNSSNDGISLQEGSSSVCRSSTIHDVSIVNAGRDAIRADGFSYLKINNVNANSFQGIGFYSYDADTSAVLSEYLSIRNSVFGGGATGIKFDNGSFISLYNVDVTSNADGLFVGGGVYYITSYSLSSNQNTADGIEFSADDASITRFFFYDTRIYMAGANATETAIKFSRASTYTVRYGVFDGVLIAKAGATSPTYSISDDGSAFDYSDMRGVWDNSGGAINLAQTKAINLELLDKKDFQTFTDGDTTPSVQGGDYFYTANTGATTITDFDGGNYGDRFTIVVNDPYTIIDFSASGIKGNNGIDFVSSSGDTLNCFSDWQHYYCDVDHIVSVSTFGEMTSDSLTLRDGATLQVNSAGDDKNVQIYHDDTDGYIKTSLGILNLFGSLVRLDTSSTSEGIVFSDDGTDAFLIAPEAAMNQVLFCPYDTAGNQIIISNLANYAKDHDHAVQENPTLFIHSDTNPDTDNTQWVSIGHDTRDANIILGKGLLNVTADSLVVHGTIASEGANNNCIITIDDNDVCDSGTEIGQDNGIAICAVCAAN